MTPQIEPIWPWRLLFLGLSTASASVVAAVIVSGLLALALPILLVRYSSSWQRRRILLGGGLVLTGLLAWTALGHAWETPLELTPTLYGGAALARLAGVGLTLLFIAPMALAGMTAATYLKTSHSWRRIAAILSLRVLAFLLALLAILRPSLAVPRDGLAGGYVLVIAVDASKSMTIQDESSQARWDFMLRTLHDAEPALEKLRKQDDVQVEFYRFGEKTEPISLNEPGAPDGKRTETGAMLHDLYEKYSGRRLRGLLVLSDGRNQYSQKYNPETEAHRWLRLHCPVHTIAYGNPNTPNSQRDVAVGRPTTTPSVVPVKGKLTVHVKIDAHGFENSTVRVHLFVGDKEEKSQDAVLKLTEGNPVTLECDAPDKAGSYKVMVKVDPLPGELNRDNNEAGTFVTVVKGGVNVLLIDKERAWEPQLIYDALARDPRIQVKPLWLRGNGAIDPNAAKLFDFDQQKYDVIIVGDVTAAQMKAIQPDVLEQMERQVSRGAGFLMIGGYASFGGTPNAGPNNSDIGDWKGTVMERMLPVDLNVRGQVDGGLYGVKMKPTQAGLTTHILQLANGEPKAEEAAWDELAGLEGVNRLAVKGGPGIAVLAVSKDLLDPATQQPYPILAARDDGHGRVLAFAGDTTSRWVRNPEGKRKHGRFWRQMVLWLARQDETESQVRVVPDVRAVAAGTDLGFSFGLRSKNGQDIKNGDYDVEVIGPDGKSKKVTPTRDGAEDRGAFRPETAGEYTIKVSGLGKDADGETASGEATAQFLAYEEDIEMSEWAADEVFLRKLADAGGGEFHRGSKLASFLEQLPTPPAAKTKPKMDAAPDWSSASWSPFFLAFFVLFTGILAGEWFLRRRWGMV